MGGGRNGRFWGAPIFGQNPEKYSILPPKDAKSGCPKNSRSYHHPSHPPVDALLTHLFLCILFSFFCPVRPSLPQAIFFPKILPFWDLRPTLSRREKATQGLGFGDGSGRGRPTGKKGKSFFLAREKRRVIVRDVLVVELKDALIKTFSGN